MTVDEPQAESAVTELVRGGRHRRAQPIARRALFTEALLGGGFLVAAVLLALLADGPSEVDTATAAVLVLCLALAGTVYIEVGGSYTSPLQLVLVPMLLLLPPQFVPLFVVLGLALASALDVAARRAHHDRLLNVPADCWFAFGPALVLVLFDAHAPDLDDWPVYLLALAAQFGGDLVISPLRERLSEGTSPRLHLRVLLIVDGIDLVLSPLGLLAALATDEWRHAYLLLVPPVVLLAAYARERSGRITAALALSDAARERQALIAGASHELVTPTAVLVGLTERLATGSELPPERRAQLDTVMHREALALRQLVRQFIDYTRLKSDRDLELSLGPVDIGTLAPTIAPTSAAHDLPPVRADADRLHQVLTSLAADVTREGEGPARIAADHDGDRVTVTVTGPAPPHTDPFDETGGAAGVALYVSAELTRLHGGTLVSAAAPGGGSQYTLELSAA